jgi:acyl transferase domain-containing protein
MRGFRKAMGEFDIAIVGMACRFPGARDVAAFWNNLAGGVE